jgi:hypothetical protein
MNLDNYAHLFASPTAYDVFVKALQLALEKHSLVGLYTHGELIGGIVVTRPKHL